jgi:hypothetical protein
MTQEDMQDIERMRIEQLRDKLALKKSLGFYRIYVNRGESLLEKDMPLRSI